jgi:thiamine-monophosphate kinase
VKIAEIGEFGLIERLKLRLPPGHAATALGAGDDTAAIRLEAGRVLLATCDVQVEGRHFRRDQIRPEQLGRRSLAVNLSDIAAMGGRSRHALISLVFPPDLDVEFVDAFYHGARAELGRAGADIIGGNLSSAPDGIVVDVTLLGVVDPRQMLLRSGAQPGDLVLVTGSLGASAAGRAILDGRCPRAADAADDEPLLSAHLTPVARIEEGPFLAAQNLASAMIDLSDGLAGDIGHVCDASNVGVRLRAADLPIAAATRAAAARGGGEPLDWALTGGEDYELLFTCPRDRAARALDLVPRQTGTAVTVIGEITLPREGRWLVSADGERRPLPAQSWDHFAGAAVAAPNPSFAAWLEAQMDLKGISQNRLATDLEVSRAAIGLWRRGGRPPTGAVLARLATYFGVDAAEIERMT